MAGTSLLVTCHPSPASLCAQIADSVSDVLRSTGVRVIIDDLCSRGFDPAVGAQELTRYCREEVPADIAELVEHLRSAEELIFVFPVWMYHMPALLKGYFDRVWRPHVSFRFEGGAIQPLLVGVRHLTAIVCHGMTEEVCDLVGDGTRVFFSKSLPSILPHLETNTRFDLYGLDTADAGYVKRKIVEIRRHFAPG